MLSISIGARSVEYWRAYSTLRADRAEFVRATYDVSLGRNGQDMESILERDLTLSLGLFSYEKFHQR